MWNYYWQVSQKISVKNKHEFETLLYQVNIVKNCEKQNKNNIGFTTFSSTVFKY